MPVFFADNVSRYDVFVYIYIYMYRRTFLKWKKDKSFSNPLFSVSMLNFQGIYMIRSQKKIWSYLEVGVFT